MKGVITMPQHLSQQELQNLRELIGAHGTGSQKLQDFANQCTDPQIKQMLQQSSQSAEKTKQQLISFLQ